MTAPSQDMVDLDGLLGNTPVEAVERPAVAGVDLAKHPSGIVPVLQYVLLVVKSIIGILWPP
jgi:hypothetical protein